MSSALFRREAPVVGTRCIHLDLKGMPPTAERLVGLPEIFAELKINALLVKWEDACFPELVGRYRQVGAPWWAGSAFKISGEGDLPPVEKRAVNTLLWMREAAARVFHVLNRYNLVVGAAYPDLRIAEEVFSEFRT